MTKRDLLKKTFSACALLILMGNGPCQQHVDLNQSAATGCTEPACTASQICVHYPSCSGGTGSYQCEDASANHAVLCDNYPNHMDTSSGLECICPAQGTDAGNPPQDGGTTTAMCGQSTCTASQVCVHYPSCHPPGAASTEGCEANDPSQFGSFCSNYGGKYTVDNSQMNVDCLCQ